MNSPHDGESDQKTPVEPPDDRAIQKAYWQSKTVQERLEALELMRQAAYGYDPDTERIQKFFEIVPFNPNEDT